MDTSDGPLEISWVEGGQLLLDAESDWTLHLTDEPWRDPFAASTAEELAALESEVGVWICRDVSADEPYRSVVGRRLTSIRGLYNDAGELFGIEADFEGLTLVARSVGGDIVVRVGNVDT